ncbi:class I SAM-dependent methyltransferase [Siccirubricoccus sp. KC 17139]|uniref:Class I SAM-dependent methyltransferase n=1 Tax=Siccirubricoccus soli TaxID=2899147 RepID=A0ABT1D2S5_9PROT|nr:class I SAM-dependent methyltransferase [Siccirubricoccus soli]MCO6416179.1 class I SAM-dependent methyltransferase [Siccirubricoccus soli]MCP2682313.1 class I SAM-dependent methyltransferase [Siccirubricoccus soli]
MGVYERFVLPRLLALAMRHRELVPFRQRVGRAAAGRVLELGIGSGLNLGFYGSDVTSVVGVDPSPALLRMAEDRSRGASFPVELVEASSERLPLEDRSADIVVTTWTMCSVGDAVQALREARRVLRPGGALLFVEHGRAPDPRVRWWQDRLTPTWRRVAGGCHLNRKMDDLVLAAGFRLDDLRTGYVRGPRPLTFMYEGRARPR